MAALLLAGGLQCVMTIGTARRGPGPTIWPSTASSYHQPGGRKVAEQQLLGLLVGVGGFNKKGLELAGPHQGPYGLPLVA